jgi:hypothetical protein
MPLHLTNVAFGCANLDAIRRRLEARAASGEVRIATRMRPKRAEELIGGHLFWIVKHTIIAGVEIRRIEDRTDGRIDIVCAAELKVVTPVPRRAHQAWRYLEDKDAPKPDASGSGLAELPPKLYGKLVSLALV